MLTNDNYFSEIAFIQNNSNISFIIQLSVCLFLAFTFYSTAFGQLPGNAVTGIKSAPGRTGPDNLSKNDSEIIIAQNSPNPFSDSTTINFYLPERNKIIVELYNGHLEKIRELKEIFPAGESKISFSAKDLEPGIYFYRFIVDDFIEVKRMVVTKQIDG